MSRPSKSQHPVAMLRRLLGLTQRELGDIVGRPERTIQAIELGAIRRLRHEFAQDIAAQTGVDLEWLKFGAPGTEPLAGVVASDNLAGQQPPQRLTRALYETHRNALDAGYRPEPARDDDMVNRLILLLEANDEGAGARVLRSKVNRLLDSITQGAREPAHAAASEAG